eukprot:CAMPEP_0198431486 /NCGR_PEP_ID=MMETSP1452-20131203/19172_1 /TAXON_ID=1181717 /ORGANISM="Synchroma pusillum, Strain CCMP3072" /LENGTH=290 /DNA_ID=CAMNT_0044151943 /DNA_START=38 /DNA_END=910 /DNA_ORIENTATION=+
MGSDLPLTPGKIAPAQLVPPSVQMRPEYAEDGRAANVDTVWMPDEGELVLMRRAATAARDVLDVAAAAVKPGVTPEDIDALVHSCIVDLGGYPSPLNYCGFPKSVCTSVNEVACHGVPDDRPLEDGDVVSIDVSLFLDGVHGDNCTTVPVGAVDDGTTRLIEATREGLAAGIAAVAPGVCVTAIGAAIQSVADRHGFGVIQEFCGHGLGPFLHMPPLVRHYRNRELVMRLREGMVFTIEPILCEGSPQLVRWEDGWTQVTRDGGRCAQFEHEVLVTATGAEVLTLPSRGD